MALIGSWGDFTFEVSRESVKTFTGLKWDSSVKYATHDRHLKCPGALIPIVEVSIIDDE